MRVAIGAVSHETNTFAGGRTTLEGFETATGESILDSRAGRSLGGIADRLAAAGADLHPTVAASAIPSPTVTADAFEWMRTALLEGIAEAPDLDGVCLDLHGSMYVADEPDPEGALLAAVRETVGDDVPVTAALDMHATITGRVVDALDGVAGYRTAPHTDVVETGERAADLLLAQLRGEASLALGWERLPMLLAGERSETDAEPMRSLIDRLPAADGRDGVYGANYFLGFPWADSPHAGCHALVTGDAARSDALAATTTELARALWERRDAFTFTTEAHPPEDALDVAAAEPGRPVVVAETGDIPSAGASQDAVDFLAAVLGRSDPGLGTPLLGIVADADSHAAAAAAGEGATVDLELGRRVDDGRPLAVAGRVRTVRWIDGVGLAVVRLDGVDVVVADGRTTLHRDPETFDRLGTGPRDRAIVVLKNGYLSPDWQAVAARRLFALTAGDTNQRLDAIDYRRVPRPIHPIDDDATWSP